MAKKVIPLLFIVLFGYIRGRSQTCITLGQNPSTAFPVCGTDTFNQSTVPYCGGKFIPGPCGVDYVEDLNPFWYKFTCFKAGTLGFLITPNDLNDDYDWQLFDVTGHDPNDIYTDASLFVACNWSGNVGLTGASSSGTSLNNCAGQSFPTFSAMPSLKFGHNYILLISHFTTFTPSQNGYKLSFGGGTGSITDLLLPGLSNANSSCDATKIVVKLNKEMKCGSLAADGSDFSISPAVSTVDGAIGIGCNNGFDMDSVMLTMKTPLPPGNYLVIIKNGADGNTLLDNCDRSIAPGNNIPLVVFPLQPTPMDSLAAVECSPKSLQLVFKKNIQCSSIADDGSDFIVAGTPAVSIISAKGNCNNGMTNVINVTLSHAIVNHGNYLLTLVKGNDGNTIFDECGQETPAGSTLHFVTNDTVSADFTYRIFQGCKEDTVAFVHDGRDGVNQWLWQLGYSGVSHSKDPIAYFNNFGSAQITLTVSNGLCSDTAIKTFSLGDQLKAAFETNNLLCPEDGATFVNKSTGNITKYYWKFGDGNTSESQIPGPHHYPLLSDEITYPVSLIVKNNSGCLDTSVNNLKVLKSCYIAVPNAFTPNGDGLNDYLYPLNAYKADNLEFNVYNRVGQLVFHTNDWTKKWDGTIEGNPQDSGIYVWMLKYVNHDTGKKVFQKGSTVLIR